MERTKIRKIKIKRIEEHDIAEIIKDNKTTSKKDRNNFEKFAKYY